MAIPIINFSAFRNGTEVERLELADRVTQEFKMHGAVRLVDHGITARSKLCASNLKFGSPFLLTYLSPKISNKSTNG